MDADHYCFQDYLEDGSNVDKWKLLTCDTYKNLQKYFHITRRFSMC